MKKYVCSISLIESLRDTGKLHFKIVDFHSKYLLIPNFKEIEEKLLVIFQLKILTLKNVNKPIVNRLFIILPKYRAQY